MLVALADSWRRPKRACVILTGNGKVFQRRGRLDEARAGLGGSDIGERFRAIAVAGLQICAMRVRWPAQRMGWRLACDLRIASESKVFYRDEVGVFVTTPVDLHGMGR